MGFHLTYLEALRVLGLWIFMPAMAILVVAGISAIYQKRQTLSHKKFKSITGFLLVLEMVMVVFGLLLPLSSQGTGWSLQTGILTVDTGLGTLRVAARDVHTQWVTHQSAYALEQRTLGTSAGSYHAGEFVLQNGRSAWVFEYGDYPVLAIFSPKYTILLSSPGITKLPHALKTSNDKALESAQTNTTWPYGMIASIVGVILALAIQLFISKHYAPYLPQRVATHFGLSGQPNGYSSKKVALWLGPIFSLVLGIPLILISALDPSNVALIAPFFLIELILALSFWWMFHMNRNQT
ncbi:MAG: hypothetical protein C7B47_02165 [Sulfobacillus thermosulfidooxidans]|uniref:DUF1648 domain-containing protein n=1 Tax=Sulfobacillus thermosulfidooxidans TaxID=28034 RepID=A0A2T2X4Y1_SULTH|nr:MAG: hypothetical protein C7B47_02165 [Sulfobacillus thermosulfidooxidans]